MMGSQRRFEPAGQGLIRQKRVEIDGRLGQAPAMAFCGDAGMEVGQGFFVIEPDGLGNKAVDKLQDAVGAIGKTFEKLFAVDACARFSFV